MSDYKIGTTIGNLVDLIDEPFSIMDTEISGFSLSGTPINVAMDKITWNWTNMSQTGWYQIYYFWVNNVQITKPPPYIYIASLAPYGFDFEYAVFRCKMAKPESRVTVSLSQLRTSSVEFHQCEQVSV